MHPRLSLVPPAAFLFATLAAACSSPGEHVEQVRERIVQGNHDVADTSVVMLIIQAAENPTTSAACSGTVISPHVILTAAHCLDERIIGKGKSVFAFFGDDSNSDAQLAKKGNFGYPASVHPHPDFDPATIALPTGPLHDIGVLVTLDPLPPTPVPLQRRAATNALVGQSVHVVGFGKTDPQDAGSYGARSDDHTPLVGFDDDHLWTNPALHSLCEGDSGGGWLLEQDGTTVVAGVSSYIEHATSCTGKNLGTRVDAYAEWIDGFVRDADPGFLPPPVVADAGDMDASTVAHPASSSPGSCTATPRPCGPESSQISGAVAMMLIAIGRRQRARPILRGCRRRSSGIASRVQRDTATRGTALGTPRS